MDDERWDGDFDPEMLYRSDLRDMSNEHHDMKVVRVAITLGAAIILYAIFSAFIVTGFQILWLALATWITFRVVDRIALYMFRRRIADEFPPESWQDTAWRKSEN